MLFSFSLLFQGAVLAQTNIVAPPIDLHGVYSRILKAAHKRTHPTWTEEDYLKAQQTIISDYEKHPIDHLGSNNLAVATAYGYCGQYKTAVTFMDRLLIEMPDNDALLHLLGMTELGLGDYSRSVKCFQKSWLDGYEDTPKFLGFACLLSRDLPAMERLVPSVMKFKKADFQIADLLVAYSYMAKPFATNVFLEAIEGTADEAILRRPDADLGLYPKGLWLTGQESRARALVAKADESNRDVIDDLLSSAEWITKVIANFEKKRALWKTNEMILVAIAYGKDLQLEKAESSYLDFLRVRPDQKRALRGLGYVYILETQLQGSKDPVQKGLGFR